MTYADPLSNSRHGERSRKGLGAKLLGGLARRYRAIRKRLSEMLGRGDTDYATMSSLSQEIGRMRQMVRNDLEQRRKESKARKDRIRDSVATVPKFPPARSKGCSSGQGTLPS